jgi:hypothetical protein
MVAGAWSGGEKQAGHLGVAEHMANGPSAYDR